MSEKITPALLPLLEEALIEEDAKKRNRIYAQIRLMMNHGATYPTLFFLSGEEGNNHLPEYVALDAVDFIAYMDSKDYRSYDFKPYQEHCYMSYLILFDRKLTGLIPGHPISEDQEPMKKVLFEAIKAGDDNMMILMICIGWDPTLLTEEEIKALGEKGAKIRTLKERLTKLSAKPILRKALADTLQQMPLMDLLFLWNIRVRKIDEKPSTWTKYYDDFKRVIIDNDFWVQKLKRDYPQADIDYKHNPWYGYNRHLYVMLNLVPKIRLKDAKGKEHTVAMFFNEGRGLAYAWQYLNQKIELLGGDLQSYVNGYDDVLTADSILCKKYSVDLVDLVGNVTRIQYDHHCFVDGCFFYCELAGMDPAQHIKNPIIYTYS